MFLAAAIWTLFTFLTPISAKIGLGYLLLCRVLLGVGEVGFIWSILWQIYGKSSPNEYSGISQEELVLILKGKQKNKPIENLSYHGESTTNENDTATPAAPLNNFVNEEDNEFGSEVDALLPKKSMSNPNKVPWKLILSRLELDIAPKYAGVIYGLGHTSAGISALLGVAFTGWILDITNRNWNVVWILVTAFYSI
ncbi:1057_t:CDS:2, partial [Racocetra fulgida]